MTLPTAPTQALKIYRETALPGSLESYAIYMIAPSAAGMEDYVEMYVTDSSGYPRRIVNRSDIDTMIGDAIGAANEISIVADITERNTVISPGTTGVYSKYVFVIDATADTTVATGGATYMYNPAVGYTDWIKISEAESLDLVIDWADIQNGPLSSTTDIDDAVDKRHSHTNKTQLDNIDEDANGLLTYNGVLPLTGWQSTSW
jgi:hypothetical protein